MLHRYISRAGAMAAIAALVGTAGCRETSGPDTPDTSLTASATAPPFERSAPATAGSAPPVAAASASSPTAADGAADEADDGGDDGAGGKAGDQTADAPPTEPDDEAPLPDIEVRNVGMHIGGEENTAAQKRPIRAEVEKHYDAMKRCWAMATEPPDKATFGVDMRIDGKGGPAKITNPRSGLKGDGVKDCMVAAFEAVDFPRQPGGVARMVSYSVEFRKK